MKEDRPFPFGFSERLEGVFRELQPDLIHFHGIWQWKLHQGVRAARRAGIPYIIAPRGMLEPWALAYHHWKKALAMRLYQWGDLTKAVAIHATAQEEVAHIRDLGIQVPVIVSPNGVNVPAELPPRKLHSDGFHRALFVSRIHEKKGLKELVEAWSLVRPKGWKMEIVGTDADHYQHVIEKLVLDKGLQDDFIFTGPLDDEKKWEAYRRADLFILPTYSENFGIVVAEALYAGVPVITTQGTPWKELETTGSGWWIPCGADALCTALESSMKLDDQLRAEMGKRGRCLIDGRYSWPSIARQLSRDYAKLLAGKS